MTGIIIDFRPAEAARWTMINAKLAVMIEPVFQTVAAALAELALPDLMRTSGRVSLRTGNLLADPVGDQGMPALLSQISAQRIVPVHDDPHLRSHIECLPEKVHRNINLSITIQLIPEQVRQHTYIRFKMRKYADCRRFIDLYNRIVRIQSPSRGSAQHKCRRHTHQHVGSRMVADNLSAFRFQRGADQVICRCLSIRTAGNDDFALHLGRQSLQDPRIDLHGKLAGHRHPLLSRNFTERAERARRHNRRCRSYSHVLSSVIRNRRLIHSAAIQDGSSSLCFLQHHAVRLRQLPPPHTKHPSEDPSPRRRSAPALM